MSAASTPPIPTPPSSLHRLPTISASQALSAQSSPSNYLSTGSSAFDTLLGGYGLPRGQVVDICGPPGVGKTAIAAQAAANAASFGHQVIWVDTANPVSSARLGSLTPAASNITHIHAPTLPHLLALILAPPPPLSDFALLVLDNVSTPFHVSFPPGMEDGGGAKKKSASARRYPVMIELISGLSKLAATRKAAVVLVQGMVTRVVPGVGGVLAPALGFRGWIDAVAWRLAVFRRQGGKSRSIALLKGRGRVWDEGEGPEVVIDIVGGGIGDVKGVGGVLGKRKRGVEAVVPDSEGEEEDELIDGFGWEDDGAGEIGDKDVGPDGERQTADIGA